MAKAPRGLLTKVFNKEVDFNSDTLVWTLHTSTFSPNYDTLAYVSDLSNELGTGGGYTSGGLAIASPTMTYTAANSFGTQRANTTAYVLGQVVRPATGNGFLYRCSAAGTSAGSPPTFNTVIGGSTTDNTVTWECIGSGIVTISCANVVWGSATFGPCRYAVLSDRSTGVAATEPVVAVIDFGVDKTGGGGNFTLGVDTTIGLFSFAMV